MFNVPQELVNKRWEGLDEVYQGKINAYYVLFDCRHPIPGNPSALASSYDFINHETEWIEDALAESIEILRRGGIVAIFITGFTPTLLEWLNLCTGYKGMVICLHYDRNKKDYWAQELNLHFSTK